MAVELDPRQFWPRLATIFKGWKEGGNGFGATATDETVDSLLIVIGKDDEENASPYSRSLALQLYLFSYALTESVLLFHADGTIHVLTSSKKKELLESMGTQSDDKALKVRQGVSRRDARVSSALL